MSGGPETRAPFAEAPPAGPPMEATVTDDLVCIGCGYNLRTLRHVGRCPECGQSVHDTVTIGDLNYAPPDYVRRLAGAAKVLAYCFGTAAAAAVLATPMFVAVWTGASARAGYSLLALLAMGLAAYLVGCIASFTFCQHDPRIQRRDARRPSSLPALALAALLFSPFLLPAIVCAVMLPSLLAERVTRLAGAAGHDALQRRAVSAALFNYAGAMVVVFLAVSAVLTQSVIFVAAVPPVVAAILLVWCWTLRTLVRVLRRTAENARVLAAGADATQ